MKVLGLAGWSGSGKTTLVVRLIPELTGRGLTVSTMKHAHHAFDVDTPGKDSHSHRLAGAREVMVASSRRWALMNELRGAPEPDPEALLARMSPVDLVLIEGFRHHSHDRIEVWRRAVGQPLLSADDPGILAVASDTPLPEARIPVFDMDDIPAIADFIERRILGREPGRRRSA